MKKIHSLLISLTIGLSMYANPISLPRMEFSELYFDEYNDWKLELAYYEYYSSVITIDSIALFSTTDTITYSSFQLNNSSGIIVITADSLISKFRINPNADSLKLIYYAAGQDIEDILIFGNTPGSTISSPRQGQSICRYNWSYVKDNSPTIGLYNDTIGIFGTLKGVIYDKNNAAVQNREFLLDNRFTSSDLGAYSTRVCSKASSYNKISYTTTQNSLKFSSMTNLSYVMEPDSVVELDIHLLDSLITSSILYKVKNAPINIYPNPIATNEMLKLNIDLPIVSSNIWVELVDLKGTFILKEKVNQTSSLIKMPTKSGLYVLRVILDSKIIASEKIIVNE